MPSRESNKSRHLAFLCFFAKLIAGILMSHNHLGPIVSIFIDLNDRFTHLTRSQQLAFVLFLHLSLRSSARFARVFL